MLLFANGCSWTWGGGLNKLIREQSTWPSQLGLILNQDVVNLSTACGSNQRIVRTTFDWLNKQPQDILENTLAVIQWTEASRYEYYVHSENLSDEENWAKAKVNTILSNEKDLVRRYNRNKYRLETFTDLEGSYSMLNWTSALASMFNHFKIKYYYWTPNFTKIEYPNHVLQYMLDTQSWIEFSDDYDRITKHDCHPSINGHKQIAARIYDLIK